MLFFTCVLCGNHMQQNQPRLIQTRKFEGEFRTLMYSVVKRRRKKDGRGLLVGSHLWPNMRSKNTDWHVYFVQKILGDGTQQHSINCSPTSRTHNNPIYVPFFNQCR